MAGNICFENIGFLEQELPLPAASIPSEFIEGSAEVQRFISSYPREFSDSKKRLILEKLGVAELFENFLHTKYVGQKRFSIEGAETVIPMLTCLLQQAAEEGMEEVVIGMSHRGRLNVLANVLNKPYREIFFEFEDIPYGREIRAGDVKYHKGYRSRVGGLDLWLVDNPSHLESVDPVVEGITRAHQQLGRKSLPLLIHGDAAICGQGVVYETLQLSGLKGYTTGGTIHLVINNNIGFTASPEDSRSTLYCTDIAKTFGFPVFHVDAEDPELCVWAIECAFAVRQRFGIDVLIDLHCVRKYGHNEGDEPFFTQPLVYQEIARKEPIRSLYAKKFQDLNIKEMDSAFWQKLQTTLQEVKEQAPEREAISDASQEEGSTCVDRQCLEQVARAITAVPPAFTLHPRIDQSLRGRAQKIHDHFSEMHIDWSFAESLAIGTLLQEGKHIRFTGQDTRRGTFSHRHGVWVDQVTAKEYFPQHAVAADPKSFELVDSPLSEYAALGFEYGYSLGRSDALVLWEAQFGDFVNTAQVIIDQYLASGESKWGVSSGLVLLLPHGYEGQGPEHSSSRIERFLSLCADKNFIIANPTTPAQLFHLLRRQALHRGSKKPLVVFTPKGLLRHPQCTSTIQDLENGAFQEILDDLPQYKQAKKLLFCQGRIYYDLIAKRRDTATAIVRIEQLYPFDQTMMESIIAEYASVEQFFWVQEEPRNMGAWSFLRELIEPLLPKNQKLEYRGRVASSSPAVASHHVHEQESEALIRSVF